MTGKLKIITMTKLAVYDKNEGDADRLANEYFRSDYIYRQNMWTRLCVGAGAAILVGLYWLRMLIIDGVDFFAMDLQKPITDSVLFVLAVLAVYTVIGTIHATRRYYLVQKRLEHYQGLLYHLQRINERARRQSDAEEVSEDNYGTGIDRKRNRY